MHNIFVQKRLRLGSKSLGNENSGQDRVKDKPWMLTITLVELCIQESYKLKAMPKVANCSGFEGRNGLPR